MNDTTINTENGVIESTMLGYEDHGILTAYVFIKFHLGGCGFGGWALDDVPIEQHSFERTPSRACGQFIARVLKTVGVETWEDLKGKPIRCRTTGLCGGIVAIGHYIEDRWFCPNDEMRSSTEN